MKLNKLLYCRHQTPDIYKSLQKKNEYINVYLPCYNESFIPFLYQSIVHVINLAFERGNE